MHDCLATVQYRPDAFAFQCVYLFVPRSQRGVHAVMNACFDEKRVYTNESRR